MLVGHLDVLFSEVSVCEIYFFKNPKDIIITTIIIVIYSPYSFRFTGIFIAFFALQSLLNL